MASLERAESVETIRGGDFGSEADKDLPNTQPPDDEDDFLAKANNDLYVVRVEVSGGLAKAVLLRSGGHAVGRKSTSAICLEHDAVSREHLSLTVGADGGVKIKVVSFAGVFLNGKLVKKDSELVLQEGDKVFIRPDFHLKFVSLVDSDDASILSSTTARGAAEDATAAARASMPPPPSRAPKKTATGTHKTGRTGRRRKAAAARQTDEGDVAGPSPLDEALAASARRFSAVAGIQDPAARRTAAKLMKALDHAANTVVAAVQDGTAVAMRGAASTAILVLKKASADSKQSTQQNKKKRKRDSDRAAADQRATTTAGVAGAGRKEGSERRKGLKGKHQQQKKKKAKTATETYTIRVGQKPRYRVKLD